MAFCVLDCNRVGHYSLPAGHIARRSSRTAVRSHQIYSFLRDSLMCKLLVSSRSGRTGEGHLRVCWFILPSPRTLSRSATIILMSAELPIKRSWLCTSIISWLSMPKAITTQLKILKQLDCPKVFRL